MNSIDRLVRNSSVLFLSTLFQKLAGFIVVVVLARYLGAEAFGRYSFMMVFVLMIDGVMCYGVDVLMVREVAKDRVRGDDILKNVLSLKMALFPAAVAAAAIALSFINVTPRMKYLIILLAVSQFFYSITKTFNSFFSAHERLGYTAVLDIIFSAVKAALILSALLLGLGLDYVIFAIALSYLCVFIAAVYIYHGRFSGLSPGMDWAWLRDNLSNSVWFILYVIISGYYRKIDQLIIADVLHYERVGMYSTAFLFIDLAIAVSLPYFTSVYPLISRIYNERRDYEQLVDKSYKYFIITSLPIPFLGLFIIDGLIGLVYGPSFAGAAPVVKIFLFAIPFIFVQSFVLRIAFSTGAEKRIFFLTASVIIAKVLLNYILLGAFGLLAAALIMVVVEIFYTVLIIVFCLSVRDFDLRKVFAHSVKPFLATLAMVAGLYFTRHIGVLWSVPCAVILYLASLAALKAFDSDELLLFSRALRILTGRSS